MSGCGVRSRDRVPEAPWAQDQPALGDADRRRAAPDLQALPASLGEGDQACPSRRVGARRSASTASAALRISRTRRDATASPWMTNLHDDAGSPFRLAG